MDQKNTQTVSSSSPNIYFKRVKYLQIIICLIVSLLLAVPIGFMGYHLGYNHGQQQKIITHKVINVAKKIPVKSKDIEPTSDEPTPEQTNSYTLIYIPPAGWRSMVWHPDPNSAGSAMLSPDYTSIDDPEPQTGMTILIFQFPQQYTDMKQLRGDVEVTEDNMKGLVQTTVAGFPTWHATFVSTDSDRVVEDYNIFKDHDRWIIRMVLPGNSLPEARAEEQKYSYQINELLQSVQFKTIQYH